MSHKQEKSADNGQFLSADKNWPISCHTRKILLVDFFGCGVNRANSDEEAAVDILRLVA